VAGVSLETHERFDPNQMIAGASSEESGATYNFEKLLACSYVPFLPPGKKKELGPIESLFIFKQNY